jgi:clan AA aspartic protease (TIGR02281 family)
MRRRLFGVACAIGAVLLDPTTRPYDRGIGQQDVRLERLTVPEALEAANPPRPLAQSARHDIPLRGGRTHLIVDGILNGLIHGPMLVDTGASYCVLTRRTARQLGLAARPRRTIPVATANGRIDAGVVAIAAIELQDAHLADVDAVIMDAVEPPFIGIIGLNFLTRFRFSVDSTQGVLRLEP